MTREFLAEVIYYIAEASNATRLYWCSLDGKFIYKLAHNAAPTDALKRAAERCVIPSQASATQTC